jgi:hypothetical protein
MPRYHCTSGFTTNLDEVNLNLDFSQETLLNSDSSINKLHCVGGMSMSTSNIWDSDMSTSIWDTKLQTGGVEG